MVSLADCGELRVRTSRLVILGSLPVWLAGCAHGALSAQPVQPDISARAKPVLELGGLRFKDLNANGTIGGIWQWRANVW